MAAPAALHGVKGEILFQKRTSPFESPKRKAGGVSISPPAPPYDQKGRGLAPPFWIIHPMALPVSIAPTWDDSVLIVPAKAALLRSPLFYFVLGYGLSQSVNPTK